MAKMDRRQFLAMLGIGAAAGFIQACGGGSGTPAAGMMRFGGGSGGSGSSTQPGELFKDPPLAQLTRNGNLVETTITASRSQATINGQTVTMMLYNGSYPAPTIRVKSGDVLRVNFTNDLPRTLILPG